MRIEIGIDTGGTYTDAVAYDADSKQIFGWAKSLTTREDLSAGIGAALDGLPAELVGQAGMVSLSTTLATNACVENKGGRAKLVLIGSNRETVADGGAQYGLPKADDIWFLHSSGTMQGEVLEEPDWDAFLRESEDWFRDAAAVAVVEVLAVWNNAVLEKRARDRIAAKYSLPVVCGHELFNDLNALQRAAGTLLNARLIPVIEEFLDATKRSLDARGIAAPVVVVRSDGTLMSAAFAAVRPVETLLCGPAASVKGGVALAEEPESLIVDMGGTTTDIAVVRGGEPVKAAEGIRIGRWRTFVKGVFIETFGLGGDSAVRFDRRRALTLGPERVLPLSAAAARWPSVTQKLRTLTATVKRHTEPLHEFYCLVKDVSDSESYTAQEWAFCRALRNGPLILTEAAAAAGSSAYRLDVRRLEREGVVLRAGLTPTDIMHIRGDFSRYDAEAAALGARFVAGAMGMDVDELCEAVYDEVKSRLYRSIARLLLELRYPDYRKHGLGDGLERLIARGWQNAKRGDSQEMLEFRFRTHAALVGVGAPTHIFLADVAKALGTRCVVPEHAGVANALGAVVGSIRAEVAVDIAVEYSVEGISGYIVYGRQRTQTVVDREEAIALAVAEAEAGALEEARLRGAAGDIAVVSEVRDKSVRAADRTQVLLGLCAVATATGSVAL